MFKNLIVYRMGPDAAVDSTLIEAALQAMPFVPCGPTQDKSVGWVEPRGIAHAALVESINGHLLMQLKTEQRVVPGSVVKRRVEEIAEQIERETGRKPGKKQTKELKEQALHELLPMAFTKQSNTRVWLAPRHRLLVLDCGSQGKADEVVTLLIKAIDGLALSLIQTQMSPAMAMAHWLGTGEAPYAFSIDRECELKSADEMKSVVRYARHPLDTEEVKQHIVGGKVPTKVAMTWRERVSFMLTESLQLKKLAFLEGVFDNRPSPGANKDEAFDADAAIATGELIDLIPDLLEALGGELVIGEGSTVPSDGAGPRAEPAPSRSDAAPASPTVSDQSAPWD